MATIEKTIEEAAVESGPLWPAVARQLRAWAASRALQLRDTVLLLPFAALLAPARAAFAADGGWQPRIETTRTLSAALAPPSAAAAGQVSGNGVLDALTAAALLRQQPWGAAQARHDRRAFAHTVRLVVDAAQALRTASLLRPPAQRAPFWSRVRDALPAAGGPGAFEALLLRVALEWAAQGGAAVSDVLFFHRPAAWAVLRIGGSDELAEAVAAAAAASAQTPVLLLDADAAPGAGANPERWVCDSTEDEAWAAATQVIQALNDGRGPVALVALDRVQVRRVRALLERQSVPLIDETGWKLSTTRAAARLMALLRAAAPSASADARLDWLKGWPPAAPLPLALNTLEALWRGVPRPGAVEAADALWLQAQRHLRRLADLREQPLSRWLDRIGAMLADDGSLAAMQADAAGAQVLQALRLTRSDDGSGSADAPAWRAAADQSPMDLPAFTAWVDAALEAAQFLPPPDAGAQVVLTPLARAIGRPFGAVVAPGADQQHLGDIEPAPALIGEALAARLGLDSAARRHQRQRLAFTQLLRAPSVNLLRRRLEGDEPLPASPEVEALALARAAAGTPLQPERPWRGLLADVVLRPLQRPSPAAAADLPQALSASTVEALRQCPYRFFGRAVLRLSDRDELDADVAKRDYGTWVHAVLHRFHSQQAAAGAGAGSLADGGAGAGAGAGADARADVDADAAAALAAAADAITVEQQLDAGELLPFRASFDVLAPAYLAWLADRTALGWRWQQGETERVAAPAALHPQTLRGRLDRLDAAPGGGLQLIDYKTGRADKLTKQAANALEDTQLAFYAALEPATQSAIYLALDDAKAPLAIAHDDVVQTAAVMVDALAGEFARLRGGAGLPALGEGNACSYCEARGLCRRDHWSAA